MMSNNTKQADEERRVVPFQPRGPSGRGGTRWRSAPPPPPPVEGLAKYEGGEADDDYRHRMMVNLAAFVVTVLLAIAGGWLAIQIAELRKNQDCALSGRRNCTPIDVKPLERR
jgi:hypothetical protein